MLNYWNWKLRNKLTLPLLGVVVISAVIVTLVFQTTIEELTERILPQERSVTEIHGAWLDLIHEYREFDIKSKESARQKIDEIEKDIEELEAKFQKTAGVEIHKIHYVEMIKTANQKIRKTGNELVQLRLELVRQMIDLESIEDNFDLIEMDISSIGGDIQPASNATDAAADPDHQYLELNLSVELVFSISRLFAELREYLTNPDNETLTEIAEIVEDARVDLASLEQLIQHEPRKSASLRIFQANYEALVVSGVEIIRLSDAYELAVVRFEYAADKLLKILDAITFMVAKEVNNTVRDGFLIVNSTLVLCLILVFAISWFTAGTVVKSVNSLSRAAKAYGLGHLQTKVNISQIDEIGLLGKSFEKMAANLLSVQKALGDSRDRTETILSRIVDGIITCRKDGTIETCNLSAARLIGGNPSDLIGQSLDSILAEEHMAVAAQTDIDLSILVDTGQCVEFERITSSGDTIAIEISATHTKLHNDEEVLIISLSDVTERNAADRMKAEFISTVSHELRTPLTSIKGSLNLISNGTFGKVPEKMSQMFQLAERNTNRLISLVNDLLDVEQMQSGKMEFNMKKVSLTEIVNDAVAANVPYADEHKVNLKLTQSVPNAFVLVDKKTYISSSR